MKKKLFIFSMIFAIVLNSTIAFADTQNTNTIVCHGVNVDYCCDNNGNYKTIIVVEGDTPIVIDGIDLVEFLAKCMQKNYEGVF